jgi:uncharacterized OB-fold protein
MEYKLTFEQYQKGLAEGKFLGLKCGKCDAYTFPPQGVCTECGDQDMEVTEMKGKGTLRNFTVIRVAPEGMKPPYIVAMVELDEGPWATGNLMEMNLEEADMSLIGRKVKLGSRAFKSDPRAEEDSYVLTFMLT